MEFMITPTTTLDELFDYACGALKNVNNGEEFLVKDLFTGYEWNRIPLGLRTKLGSKFYRHVTEVLYDEISPLKKTPQNQQVYVKR